jgi:hypothetical protein
MNWFFLGVTLLALRAFWGLGLTLLLLPVRLRRYWLVLAPLTGATLQIAVVWLASKFDLPGTERYVWFSLVIPVGLAVWGLNQHGLRQGWADIRGARKLSGCVVVMLVALAVLILPASRFGKDPTTVSLGGCDAATYAAGADAFQNFARSDRTGFLGQVGENQNLVGTGFHEMWMNYDHFGPVALLAMSASSVGKEAFKIATIEAATYWAMLLPMVFWVARRSFGMGPMAAWAATLILAVSPVAQFVVHHGLLGQILATGALLMLWWASAEMIKKMNSSQVWRYVAWATVGNALLIGSYSFFLPLAYAPLVLYAALSLGWGGRRTGGVNLTSWLRSGRQWAGMMGVSLLIAGGFFFSRVEALPHLYADLGTEMYGWPIPVFNFGGFLGSFGDHELARSSELVTWFTGILVMGALGVCLRQGILGRPWLVRAGALFFGSVVLYGSFATGWLADGTVSSYQAFKVISVSYPLVFLGLVGGFELINSRSLGWRLGGWGAMAAMLAVNGVASARMAQFISTPSLGVGPLIRSVRDIRKMEHVESINILFPEVWPRLWASALLNTKKQYFDQATYEGRPKTRLDGAWDLDYNTVMVVPSEPEALIWVNRMYHLTKHEQARKVSGLFDSRWHREEADLDHRWRWSNGIGGVNLNNHLDQAVAVKLRLRGARSLPGAVTCQLRGEEIYRGLVGSKPDVVMEVSVVLNPGPNWFEVDPLNAPLRDEGGGRVLGFALYGLDIVLPAE